MSFQCLRSILSVVRQTVVCSSKYLPNALTSNPIKNQISLSRCTSCTSFHTTTKRFDLKEFFEDEKNWKDSSVQCGRPWKLDELRIKSNEDLHKLWYVLLKERNMLMTMEAEYKRLYELFPSPERIDKVEESMENILSVVKERNEAYNVLEIGVPGPPKGDYVRHALGFHYFRRFRENLIPKYMNKRYQLLHSGYQKWMSKYLPLYYEQKRKERNRKLKNSKRMEKRLKEKYPHLTKIEIKSAVLKRRNQPY